MKERNCAVPAVYLLLERADDRVLLVERCNMGYQDGNWSVPAGHIELGELPGQAIIREAREEVGITLLWYHLELAHVSYRPKHDETGDRVDFLVRTNFWEGEVKNCEPGKFRGFKWVAVDDFPHNVAPVTKHMIWCVKHGIVFSEISLDWIKS